MTLSRLDSDNQKPAPFPLRLVQEFVNSLDKETGMDDLATSATAARWFGAAGMLTRSARVTSSEVQQMRALREDIRQLLGINGNGSGFEDMPALDKQLRDTPVKLALSQHDRLVVSLGPFSSGTQAMSQLVGVVFSAQESGTWRRLKVCRNDACRWAFYDSSRNRSGTWCSMQECGNRLNNREFRNRQRS